MALANHDTMERRGEALEAVYFPLDSVASVVERVEDTEVEIVTVGNEGVVGIHTFLGATTSPYDTYCQVPGRVLRLPVAELRSFLAGDGGMHRLFRAHAQVLIAQLSRNVICHQLHLAEQRTARWLLTTHDRAGGDTFTLTQEFLAQMLGLRRMTISETAARFQHQGLIRYSRGRITITDRTGLETTSCDCYRLLRDQTRDLLDAATG
jgi:CRP-like cAMP-binding protein